MVKKLLLIVLTIVFFTVIYLYKDLIIGFFNNAVNTQNKEKLVTFPNQTFKSGDDTISLSTANLVLESYGSSDGIEYANVIYNIKDDQIASAKLLLRISEDKVNAYLNKLPFDDNFRKDMVERYSKQVEIYQKVGDEAQEDPSMVYNDIELFKEYFSEGRLIKTMLISTMPDKPIDKECIDIHGSGICFVILMTTDFSPDIVEFWKGEQINSNSILVPFAIYE